MISLPVSSNMHCHALLRCPTCYRVAWQKIPHAIIRLDPKAFQTADDVRAVLQCAPTQDEGNLLQSYVRAGGKLEGLSDAELFCLELMKVELGLSVLLCASSAMQCAATCSSCGQVGRVLTHSCSVWGFTKVRVLLRAMPCRRKIGLQKLRIPASHICPCLHAFEVKSPLLNNPKYNVSSDHGVHSVVPMPNIVHMTFSAGI